MKKLIVSIIICVSALQMMTPLLSIYEQESITFNTILKGNSDIFVSCYVFTTIKIVMDLVVKEVPSSSPAEKKSQKESKQSNSCDNILIPFDSTTDIKKVSTLKIVTLTPYADLQTISDKIMMDMAIYWYKYIFYSFITGFLWMFVLPRSDVESSNLYICNAV